jgi:hypothetical protein
LIVILHFNTWGMEKTINGYSLGFHHKISSLDPFNMEFSIRYLWKRPQIIQNIDRFLKMGLG